MNHPALSPHRPRSTQRRLVRAAVVACGLVAGLVELFALQRRLLREERILALELRGEACELLLAGHATGAPAGRQVGARRAHARNVRHAAVLRQEPGLHVPDAAVGRLRGDRVP